LQLTTSKIKLIDTLIITSKILVPDWLPAGNIKNTGSGSGSGSPDWDPLDRDPWILPVKKKIPDIVNTCRHYLLK